MSRNQNSVFYGVDRITILTYILLVVLGWLNIYAAVYNEEHQSIFDTSQKYGKQLIWIGGAAVIAFTILLIDANAYAVLAYGFYGVLLVANILVVWLGREIKGSRSWFGVGGFGIQPAEFMKFATNLALAKFLSQVSIQEQSASRYKKDSGTLYFLYYFFTGKISRLIELIRNPRVLNTVIAASIIGMPLIIIKFLQDETGLAIVFVTFVFVLYREGLSIEVLVEGMVSIILFVLALIMNNTTLYLAIVGISVLAFFLIKRDAKNILGIIIACAVACAEVFSTSYIYNKLDDHQKKRINVLFNIGEVNVKKEAYNINQSLIAIGSGGFFGKGYLQGTQTKYDFVPEQDTDFIFCTVGEEWGFIGSTAVIVLELFLILRVIFLAERQRSDFSRIYGYGVAAILFFHVAINIGMTIGLMPVIGIPLPFFSYGGSALWSFTILLFIFIKLDSQRLLILR
jgi:rod shape determining protein RodA